VHPITSLQSEYSLLERSVEREVLPACEELGIGFLPFAPLVRGLLAGSLTATTEVEKSDYRSGGRFPRVGPEHRAANAELAQVVQKAGAPGLELSEADEARLETLATRVSGERYSAEQQTAVRLSPRPAS
jgi:aryl-alcohol dehydrogenase-like predicted oxidoreductase